MQTDPIGYDDGMNMYAYVGNDPVNMWDPTGLKEDDGECGGPGQEPCPVDGIDVVGGLFPFLGGGARGGGYRVRRSVDPGDLDGKPSDLEGLIVKPEEKDSDQGWRCAAWQAGGTLAMGGATVADVGLTATAIGGGALGLGVVTADPPLTGLGAAFVDGGLKTYTAGSTLAWVGVGLQAAAGDLNPVSVQAAIGVSPVRLLPKRWQKAAIEQVLGHLGGAAISGNYRTPCG